MRENRAGAIVIKCFVVLIALGMGHQAMAQNATTHYPKIAPIDRYLMVDREAEIALARSAAPGSIARDAEVQVLGRRGFRTAAKGKNGFVCIVGRSWTSAADEDYWDPRVRMPMCLNAAAARSYLLRITKITNLALAGHTLAQVNEAIAAAIVRKELPPMESGRCATGCRSKDMVATASHIGLRTSCFSIRTPIPQFGERICRVRPSLLWRTP